MKKRATLQKRTHAPQDVARAVSLFFTVRRMMRARFTHGKKIDPSTWLQIETVKFIFDHHAPSMKDVAEYLSITAPSASALVRELERHGFITSHADLKDRRVSRLTLTPKGKLKLKKAVARGVQVGGALFSALSDEELAAFSKTLERIKHAKHG